MAIKEKEHCGSKSASCPCQNTALCPHGWWSGQTSCTRGNKQHNMMCTECCAWFMRCVVVFWWELTSHRRLEGQVWPRIEGFSLIWYGSTTLHECWLTCAFAGTARAKSLHQPTISQKYNQKVCISHLLTHCLTLRYHNSNSVAVHNRREEEADCWRIHEVQRKADRDISVSKYHHH